MISVEPCDSKLPWALTLATLKLVMRPMEILVRGVGEGLVVGRKIMGPNRLWMENQCHLSSHTDDQDFQLQEGLGKSVMTQMRQLPRARSKEQGPLQGSGMLRDQPWSWI